MMDGHDPAGLEGAIQKHGHPQVSLVEPGCSRVWWLTYDPG